MLPVTPGKKSWCIAVVFHCGCQLMSGGVGGFYQIAFVVDHLGILDELKLKKFGSLSAC